MAKIQELQGKIDNIEGISRIGGQPTPRAHLTASGAVRNPETAHLQEPGNGSVGETDKKPGPAAQCAACGHSFADHVTFPSTKRPDVACIFEGCQCSIFQSEAQCNTCRHPQSAHKPTGCVSPDPTRRGNACICKVVFSYPKPKPKPKAKRARSLLPAGHSLQIAEIARPPEPKGSPLCACGHLPIVHDDFAGCLASRLRTKVTPEGSVIEFCDCDALAVRP